MSADLGALARSVFCIGVDGTDAADVQLAELRAFGPGAIILFGRNVAREGDLRALIAALRGVSDPPPLIAIDQEGGRVARVRDPALVAQLPSAMALGAAADIAASELAGTLLGRDLARLGVSVNFAPCADLALDARSTVLGTRSFGDVPGVVAAQCTAFARGLERGGVAAALKHFPGHGSTALDSHLALPRIGVDGATFRTRDLVPFREALAAGAASIVMTAHVIADAFDPAVPATLSAPIVTGLLRGEFGFDGVIATDCLEMDAIAGTVGPAAGAVQALAAGADLLVVSHAADVARAAAAAVVAAVEDGTLARSRLEEAAARVVRLRARLARLLPFEGTVDATLPATLARRAVTVLRGEIRLRAAQPVTVISFEGSTADGVSGPGQPAASLSAALRAQRWKSELMRVALDPDPDDIALLLAHLPALGDRNFVVLMRRAHLFPAQQAAVERILACVPEAVLISALEPYDAALFPAARRLACIYGDDAVALAGCADVLAGRAAAAGTLPVTIDRDALVR